MPKNARDNIKPNPCNLTPNSADPN